MQEYTTDRSLGLCITTTKLTTRAIVAAYKVYQNKRMRGPNIRHGKQKLKHLLRHGRETDVVEVASGDMKDFRKLARQYGVDYAIRKDKTFETPKYFVFFKSTDLNVLTAMMKEAARRQQIRAERPSVREKLQRFAEVVKNIPAKVREKVEELGGR